MKFNKFVLAAVLFESSQAVKTLRDLRGRKNGSKGGKGKGKNDDGVCPDGSDELTEPVTVPCQTTITEPTLLASGLFCEINQNSEAAIIVSGENAVLDCANNPIINTRVVGNPPPPNARGTGIIVMNGGTVKNCRVSNFRDGITMQMGDNTLLNSVAYGNGRDGVRTEGTAHDMVIQDVTAHDNGDDGFHFLHRGSLDLTNVLAYNNGDNMNGNGHGFTYNPDSGPGILEVNVNNLQSINNVDSGFNFIDPFVVNFDGNVVLANNGARGLNLNPSGPNPTGAGEVNIIGNVQIYENGAQGIRVPGTGNTVAINIGPDEPETTGKSGKTGKSKSGKTGKSGNGRNGRDLRGGKNGRGKSKSKNADADTEASLAVCSNGADDIRLATPGNTLTFDGENPVCVTTSGVVVACQAGCVTPGDEATFATTCA